MRWRSLVYRVLVHAEGDEAGEDVLVESRLVDWFSFICHFFVFLMVENLGLSWYASMDRSVIGCWYSNS